jgi:predicted O-linked N-acetylglucosamine transferase (SPINDLY family)
LEHQQGRFAEAAARIQQAIAIDPAAATYHQHLAEALRAQGDLQAALASYRRAVELDPSYAVAWSSLAAALTAIGQANQAEEAYRTAIELQPELPEPHNNLGTLLRQSGRWSAARHQFEAALRINPGFVEAWNNLGNAVRDGGDSTAAVDAYRRALEIRPDYAPARFNLGVALHRLGDPGGAAEAFRCVARLQPEDAEALANLAAALNDLGDCDAAAEACRRALAIDRHSAVALGNWGVALQAQGEIEQAIAIQRKAIALKPDDAGLHGNLLYALNFSPDQDAKSVFGEHRAWAARHADPLSKEQPPQVNDRSALRRLRVGYVSAHFRAHAVNAFAEPLLAAHDREAVDLFCYSNVPAAQCDAVTARLCERAGHWREIAALSDEHAARMIRQDRIDVLVDLAGHIAGNRLLVFARRPAPVQVTYLGYQNTTGMQAMDYRLTDEWSDPFGATDAFYSERLVRLPRVFFCYQPWPDAPPVAPSPAGQSGVVTFGSLNSFSKVTTQVLDTWAELLAKVPDSQLIVLAPRSPSIRDRVERIFAARGVGCGRVTLLPRCSQAEYFRLMERIDIALDPFPFKGLQRNLWVNSVRFW